MNIKDVKHVAIYLRISDDKKEASGKRMENEETLRNHKEQLTKQATDNKYTYEIFQEVVTGGHSEIENRPELNSLLNRIEEFDAILVMELSRLSRNGKISELVLEYCQDYRKLIITPESHYDLNNEMDALMFRLGSAMSAHERAIIGKRIKSNKIQMTKLGLNASGSYPLGYKRNPVTKKLEIDEDTAHIVRYAFQLCRDGYGASRISQALNDLNYKTAKGNRFTTRAVKDMLKTQTYKGFMVYNDYTKTKRKGKVVRQLNNTIVIENAHPPIIEPELFDHVQKIREKRFERYIGSREKPNVKNPPSILKDLLYCDICGKKIRVSYERDRDEHFIRRCENENVTVSECNNSGWIARNVEEGVLRHVFSKKNQIEKDIDKLLSGNTDDHIDELINHKKSLEKQKLELENEMKGLLRLELKYEMEGGNNPIQEEFIREEKQKNINNTKHIEVEISKIEEQINQPSIEKQVEEHKKTVDHIEKILKLDLSDVNESDEANRILKQLIKKIYYKRVLPDDIEKLGNKNPKKKDYPASIRIEYLNG